LTDGLDRPVTDAGSPPQAQASRIMTRPTRRHRLPTDAERAFFEDLVALRRRYVGRDAQDAASVMSVHHVIAAANAAMRQATATPRIVRLGLEAN
jgi:hypothetical protein